MAAPVLIIITAAVSMHLGKPGVGAELPSVPNIIVILADDKYEQFAREAQIPADFTDFLGETAVFQTTANCWELMGITRN